jgi:hypothetical protein
VQLNRTSCLLLPFDCAAYAHLLQLKHFSVTYEQSITPCEIARQFGINSEMVHKLVADGVIMPQARRSNDGFNVFRFSRDTAYELLQCMTILDQNENDAERVLVDRGKQT